MGENLLGKLVILNGQFLNFIGFETYNIIQILILSC
jgi:hypothetical protein